MMEEITKHHISKQFNKELSELRSQVLSMGGMVEEQVHNAITALIYQDYELARSVYTADFHVNAMEVSIDENCTRILALRQPTAVDLRLIMSVIRIITDLERVGDQAERIAGMALQMQGESKGKYFIAIRHLSEHVQTMLHDALDAFARVDIEDALRVIEEDLKVDAEYESISRLLMTYMMEDPRAIPTVLNILWSARSLERIAAHARNICESLIYFVKGKDIRHISLEKVAQEVIATTR